jgi:anti-anti-sigma regulatory factor
VRNDTQFFRSRPTQVLVAPTELGPVAVPDFVRRIRAAFAPSGHRHLVVDLSSLAQVDPEVFRLLQWAHSHALSRGGTLEYLAPAPGVLRPAEALALRRLYAPGLQCGATSSSPSSVGPTISP